MDKLLESKEIEVLSNVLISDYSYTRLGGNVDYLAFPANKTQLIRIIEIAKNEKLPITILGRMSNLIIKDGGIRGVVVILDKISVITVNKNSITAQAGASLIDVTNYALENNLTGLEWAAGIPGSVGGAIFMNAGAYGGEIKDVVSKATFLDLDTLEFLELDNQQLDFDYRQSVAQNKNYLIFDATFELSTGDKLKIKQLMNEYNYRRIDKQPLEYPSNGSVFKRPTGYYAGKLIMDANLQGEQIGGAMISTKHANFIINLGNASAKDYLGLIELVKKTILEKDGIQMETEIKTIGED